MTDTPKPGQLTDGDLTAYMGIDGARWSEQFALHAKKVASEAYAKGEDPLVILDSDPGSWLHGWFCNAIEAGRGAGYSQAKREERERVNHV